MSLPEHHEAFLADLPIYPETYFFAITTTGSRLIPLGWYHDSVGAAQAAADLGIEVLFFVDLETLTEWHHVLYTTIERLIELSAKELCDDLPAPFETPRRHRRADVL